MDSKFHWFTSHHIGFIGISNITQSIRRKSSADQRRFKENFTFPRISFSAAGATTNQPSGSKLGTKLRCELSPDS